VLYFPFSEATPILSAINIGVAGTSAPNPDARKNYHTYSALHRMSEGIKRDGFELGMAEKLDLSCSTEDFIL
jgi:hypothetical protein